MIPATWTASDPATRLADEEDILGHLAWPTDWAAEPAANRARAVAGLERLLRLGLPFRMEAGSRRFDPYEVFFFMRWAHHRHGDSLWAESLAQARGYVAEFLPASDSSTRFELSLDRELSAGSRSAGSIFRTQFPRPSDDGSQRVVSLGFGSVDGAECEESGAAVDFRFKVPAGAPELAKFNLQLSFEVGWRGSKIDPARVEPFGPPTPGDQLFLAESEGPIQVTPRIRGLSATLSEGARTPWDAVRSFWRYIFANIEFGRIHPHVLSATDPLSSILESGRSDCYYGSALLAALCRARGVPARLVSGHFLYRRCQTNHWWSEVLVRPYGWIPCDLWSWTLADGDPDHELSELFLGRVDPRLVLERYPRSQVIFDAPAASATYTLQRACSSGADTGVELIQRDLARNQLILLDRVIRKSGP